jgi:hypothetical protein
LAPNVPNKFAKTLIYRQRPANRRPKLLGLTFLRVSPPIERNDGAFAIRQTLSRQKRFPVIHLVGRPISMSSSKFSRRRQRREPANTRLETSSEAIKKHERSENFRVTKELN